MHSDDENGAYNWNNYAYDAFIHVDKGNDDAGATRFYWPRLM